MASWSLNPALTRFRTAVNARYGARRDLESDGTIGDQAHASRSSDHNPDADGSVDAWDMDVDVNGRGEPYAADVEMLKRVFQAHESSLYWIHNDQIARRADGWRRRPYTDFNSSASRNKHIKHVHWNTRQSHEDSAAPWTLEDDMTPEQLKMLRDAHFQTSRVPSLDGTRKVNTATVGELVTEVLVLRKTVAALAAAPTPDPITPDQLKQVMEAAEREAREEVADALRQAADAAGAEQPS